MAKSFNDRTVASPLIRVAADCGYTHWLSIGHRRWRDLSRRQHMPQQRWTSNKQSKDTLVDDTLMRLQTAHSRKQEEWQHLAVEQRYSPIFLPLLYASASSNPTRQTALVVARRGAWATVNSRCHKPTTNGRSPGYWAPPVQRGRSAKSVLATLPKDDCLRGDF